MAAPTADWLSQANAHRLAATIREHWLARGYDVHTWAEPVTFRSASGSETSTIWSVRSDMRNAMPVRRAVKEAAE